MVIGNGMIAKRFAAYMQDSNFIIFASGVSNSQETAESAFTREEQLIKATLASHPEKVFVYFSTCSIYDEESQNSAYIKHKLSMEQLIQKQAKFYYIFRVTQIVGHAHNNTLVNFFYNKIKTKEHFEVWENCTRNLIDIDDIYKIVNYILKNDLFKNQIINIANKISLPIQEIILIIEQCLGSKGIYSSLQKGIKQPYYDINLIEPMFTKLAILFDQNYYVNVINKYYQDIA